MAEEPTRAAGPGGAAVVEPSAPPASPPGYELCGEIGHGGMGVVYRARDVALDRDVAVKLLSDRYAADSPAADRFLSEARITGQLQHPGIPAVHQAGTLADGRPFLVMKLIKGSSLEAILRQRPDVSADRGRLLAIFEAVCQAVGYAHAHRVIHRDLKPANVMIGAFGEVQVMDWGLAKVLGEETNPAADPLEEERTWAWTRISPSPAAGSHTEAGSLVGTPAFIPPEQAVGEIDRVNERSDVFGLGAVLAVLLTGKPPYVGEDFESVRVQAVRGKLDDCIARLDGAGAEPELVSLCKKCLAFEPADRPADAGEVAAAVAALRAAADERARRAELERVRLEGEQATVEARSFERRKRRRLAIAAAAVLAVATVGGFTAVLAVQQRANADLAAKNHELADEQAKVLARFKLAQKAIAMFHTGISEDMLLKNEEFKELRTRLLNQAAGFYADLETLLAGQTDARSRQALAAAYFQLGELTDRIGSKAKALAVHRKALAVRRELAAADGADMETRLDVARSLDRVGQLLREIGDNPGALAAHAEQRDIAERLEAEHAKDAVRSVLALSHHGTGLVQDSMGKLEEAMTAFREALAIQQKLADANPAVTEFQRDLARSHHDIGRLLSYMGKTEEAMISYRKALAIQRKLADANPGVNEFQGDLSKTYNNIGIDLSETGKPEEALTAWRQALAIKQEMADANPAVNEFQSRVAMTHINLGNILSLLGKPEEASDAHRKALSIYQKLVGADPTVPRYQLNLATTYDNLAVSLVRQKRFDEAVAALDAGLVIVRNVAGEDPKNTVYRIRLFEQHNDRGWALVRSGQPSRAAADLRRAVELLASESAMPPVTLFERSRALALLAVLGGDVKSGVTKAEASAFADQSIAALRDAIHAGWNWPHELNERDFDSLRGREDFQKLVAELAAKAGPKARPRD